MIYIRLIKKNSDSWFVQTKIIKERLSKKYLIDNKHINIKPFYPPLNQHDKSKPKNKNTFIYVSNGTPHKNHIKLIL